VENCTIRYIASRYVSTSDSLAVCNNLFDALAIHISTMAIRSPGTISTTVFTLAETASCLAATGTGSVGGEGIQLYDGSPNGYPPTNFSVLAITATAFYRDGAVRGWSRTISSHIRKRLFRHLGEYQAQNCPQLFYGDRKSRDDRSRTPTTSDLKFQNNIVIAGRTTRGA